MKPAGETGTPKSKDPRESPADCWKNAFGSLPKLGYPVHVQLFTQGEVAECVYLISSGIVKLSCVEASGKEVIVGLRCSGWLLGATQIILNEVYPVTAATLSECQLVTISRPEFVKALSTQAQL